MSDFFNLIKKNEMKNDWKSKSFHYGFAVIAFEFLSGTYLLFKKDLSTIDQFFLLFHLLLGFLLLLSLIALILRFNLYKKYWKDWFFHGLGYLSITSFSLSILTGVWLFFKGIENYSIFWKIHVFSSYIFSILLLVFIYTIIQRAYFGQVNKSRDFLLKMVKHSAIQVIILTSVISLLGWGGAKFYQEPRFEAMVSNYNKPFTKNPFFPGGASTVGNTFYKKEAFANSKSCGVSGCHTGIYQQWEDSVHYRSPNVFVHAVQKEMIKEGKEGRFFDKSNLEHVKKLNKQNIGREAYRKCAACHSPVALVSGAIDSSRPLDTFEEFDGVSCTMCHGIKVGVARGGGDYVLGVPKQYLFSDSKSQIGVFLHNTLIKNKPDFHKMEYNKEYYKDTNYCVTCHERLHYKSWLESPYHNTKNPEKTKHCQSCHMPHVVSENEISSKVKGKVADHRFIAGGLTMAKYYDRREQFEKTKVFLKDKKIASEIVSPASFLDFHEFNLIVRNANLGVGHNFPAGPEADLVEAWVHLKIYNEKEELIFEKGALDKNNYLDKNKNFVYYSHPYDSFGNKLELNKHRSWRFSEDRHQVLVPRKFHDISFSFNVPRGTKKLIIKNSFMYRRPNQEFADWVLGKGKFLVPAVIMAEDKKIIELASNKSIFQNAVMEFKQKEALQVIGDNILKMSKFPQPEFQVDVESKVIQFHIYDLLKENNTKEARSAYESAGSATKKTKTFKNLLYQIERQEKQIKNIDYK